MQGDTEAEARGAGTAGVGRKRCDGVVETERRTQETTSAENILWSKNEQECQWNAYTVMHTHT